MRGIAAPTRLNGTTTAPQKKVANEDFPLRGYVACDCCGHPMTAYWAKGRNKRYPYCECIQKGCDARRKSIRRADVEGAFEDGFEVIAGQRRLNACRIIAEDGEIDPIPCLVMAEGDDAAAIEASLAENVERLPMDEVDQYKAFAKLVKQGHGTDDIATTFGITPRMVAQRWPWSGCSVFS
jgi:hypothetical protein